MAGVECMWGDEVKEVMEVTLRALAQCDSAVNYGKSAAKLAFFKTAPGPALAK